MNDNDRAADVFEAFTEKVREQEARLPKRERLERKARVRNKYRLLEKWTDALDEYGGPGEAVLVDNYRPSGCCAPVDVPEIAGIVIWDADRRVHHVRLHRDETAKFIEMPDDPDQGIHIDPMTVPHRGVTTMPRSDGVPEAVRAVCEILEVDGPWDRACDDGDHTPKLVNEGSAHEFIACERCELTRSILTWMGHHIPDPRPTDQEAGR